MTDFTTDQISCDTELTAIRNEHPEISASTTSDTLPENGCNHLWLTKAGTAYRFKFVELCAKCGEELGEND